VSTHGSPHPYPRTQEDLAAVNSLDKFERFFERVMEGSVGRIFRSPIQPAEIGRRLERAMESNQVVSVEGIIVPNGYDVYMNPQDMVVFADFVPTLCRQMEDWLTDLAAERDYGFVDSVRVQIFGDDATARRAIHVDSSIAELPVEERAKRDEVQKTEVYRVVRSTGNVPPKLLRFVDGDYAGETVLIRRPAISIGRALDNDVIIDSADVSRHHARIEYRDGQFRLIDLDSTNGTALNGHQARNAVISDGDRITFGSINLEFSAYHGPAQRAVGA
jgi:hypothetical protein